MKSKEGKPRTGSPCPIDGCTGKLDENESDHCFHDPCGICNYCTGETIYFCTDCEFDSTREER